MIMLCWACPALGEEQNIPGSFVPGHEIKVSVSKIRMNLVNIYPHARAMSLLQFTSEVQERLSTHRRRSPTRRQSKQLSLACSFTILIAKSTIRQPYQFQPRCIVWIPRVIHCSDQ